MFKIGLCPELCPLSAARAFSIAARVLYSCGCTRHSFEGGDTGACHLATSFSMGPAFEDRGPGCPFARTLLTRFRTRLDRNSLKSPSATAGGKKSLGWQACPAVTSIWGWFHPKAPGRDHGGPLFPVARGHEKLVRAEGLEPSRTLRSNGFSCQPRLSPPPCGVCGLDYPFTVAFALGATRLVSTPSRREHNVRPGLARDCHFTGFPDFEQFYIAGFPARTQVFG